MRTQIATTLILATSFAFAAESRLEVRHREKNGVGYEEGYTSFDYLFTHDWDKPQFLLNARAHVFDDARLAANLGIGGRFAFGKSFLFGMNGFYDYRQLKHFSAQQAGAGLEFLTKRVDLRLNGYLPFGTTSYSHQKFAGFSGHSALFRYKSESTLPVAEADVGICLSERWYIAGGPYYLFKERTRRFSFGEVWGGKVRLDFKPVSAVALGVAITHDPIFNTTYQGYLSFSIPFGSRKEKPPTSYRNIRDLPIIRNEIIPVESKKKTTPLSISGNDDDFFTDIVFVNNLFLGDGDGSFETPFNSLRDAEANSKPGDIIYVLPGDGTPHNMDTGITLQDGQILAGSGSPLEIYGVEIPPLTPGEHPVITNLHPDEPVVRNPGNSNLDSFHVVEPWEYLLDSWALDGLGFSSSSASGGASAEPAADPVSQAGSPSLGGANGEGPDSFELVDHPSSDGDATTTDGQGEGSGYLSDADDSDIGSDYEIVD